MNVLRLSLNGGSGNGFDDIGDGASAAQVIDRFVQTLQHRSYYDGVYRPLDCLVGIVAGRHGHSTIIQCKAST
jgi:hypothetical protein